MKNKRRTFLKLTGGGALATTSMLAGCGGGQDGEDGQDGTPSDGGGPDGTGSDGSGSDDDGSDDGGSTPQHGGDLIVTLTEDVYSPVGTIQPQRSPGRQSNEVIHSFAEAPLRINPRTNEYEGRVAEDWRITEEGDAIVFDIREGVFFHPPYDREVKAIDVVENIHMIADPEYGAVSHGDLVGPIYESGMDPTETADETGEYEVTIHLQSRFPDYEDVFADPRSFGIIPPESYEEHGNQLGTEGVGVWSCGPFQFDEGTANDFYRVTRFEDYWEEGEGGQLPYLDSITFRVMPELASQRAALQAGDIDYMQELRGRDVPPLEEAPNMEVTVRSGLYRQHFFFNHWHFEPASDTNFRRAIHFAANKDAINASVWDGRASPFLADVPEWHRYFDLARPEFETEYGTESRFEEAQEEWNQNEYADQLEQDGFKIITTLGEKHVTTATILQQNLLQAFGINVEVHSRPRATGWGQWPGGWARDPPGLPEDQETVVQDHPSFGLHVNQMTTRMFASNQYLNLSMFQSDEYDDLAEEAQSVAGTDEEEDAYVELLKWQWENSPAVNVIWEPIMVGYHGTVRDVMPNVTIGSYFNRVWVEEDAPARTR